MTISYNDGIVSGVSSDFTNQGGQLHEIQSDTTQKVGALQEYFAGHGATGFQDAAHQMLSGLQELAETITNHGRTVGDVHESAKATDRAMTKLF